MENKQTIDSKPKSIFKFIVIILLILIVVGGSAFAGYFIASNGQVPNLTNKSAENTEEELYSLDELSINLGGSDTGRYIQVNIYLGYGSNNKKIEKELESKKQILRDKINMYLLTKKSSDINYQGLKKIKEDLLKQINESLTKGQIENIYFDSIIVQ